MLVLLLLDNRSKRLATGLEGTSIAFFFQSFLSLFVLYYCSWIECDRGFGKWNIFTLKRKTQSHQRVNNTNLWHNATIGNTLVNFSTNKSKKKKIVQKLKWNFHVVIFVNNSIQYFQRIWREGSSSNFQIGLNKVEHYLELFDFYSWLFHSLSGLFAGWSCI